MPETKNRRLFYPSEGSADHGSGIGQRSNPLADLTPPARERRMLASAAADNRAARPARCGGATDFTASQEMKLKAGDVRLAQLQFKMSKLRNEMQQTNNLINELCSAMRLTPPK